MSFGNDTFQAGRLKHFVHEWEKITSDEFILNMVRGSVIPIDEEAFHDLELLSKLVPENQVKGHQMSDMDAEVQKLLNMGVIEKSCHESGEIISPVFLVDKPDGSYRMILNLKRFNDCVEYEHFKMENLHSATDMMTLNCWMASADIRHAYYCVSVNSEYRKYLKFQWRGQLFQYTCFPNGLANCPRYFTKLLKPVYAHLRSQGLLSASFIDDCYLQAGTYEKCVENVQKTVQLLETLGFIVHKDKSVLTPCKQIRYLGFILNSEEMIVTLPRERIQKIKSACTKLSLKRRFQIRELARVIGQLVAAFPAVRWGPLFYRQLEKNKSDSLKRSRGNFDATTSMTEAARHELDWWIDNIDQSCQPLEVPDPDVTIYTDASSDADKTGGWGAVCENEETGGRWSKSEEDCHINVQELMAVELGLKSFKQKISGKHVRVRTDNTCALSYLKNMGGSHSLDMNEIAKRIWLWCKRHNVWLTVEHIPGKLNTKADFKSRVFNDRTEWMLDPRIFQSLTERLFVPEIDLFASRSNHQIEQFVSWGPDPESIAIDAFMQSWNKWLIYAFPPFSVLEKTLAKWRRDEADGILIAPLWTTAVWYPLMLQMLVQEPILLPKKRRILQLPHSAELHPLHRNLQLLACVLSGSRSKHEAFMDRLKRSSLLRGENPPQLSTHVTLQNGNVSVLDGVIIPFVPL